METAVDEQIHVIVGLQSETDPLPPELHNATILMPGMVAAQLTPTEIDKISQLVGIEYIELDAGMGIL